MTVLDNVNFVAEFAEVLIHVLEKIYEVSPEIPMQRLNLVETLVSDLAIHGKDMTNLLEAGFTNFIKGQGKKERARKRLVRSWN